VMHSFVQLPRLEGVLKPFHIYSFPVEPNPFQLQSRSLLLRSGATQLYLSSYAYDAMPRQLIHRVGT